MPKIDSLRKYKLSPRMKSVIISVVISGIIAHLYMYMNRIVNHDAVFAMNFSGATITSGRWFLYTLTEIAFMFNNNYITPWGIGAAVLILYAISACILVKTFDIKSKLLCMALGAILITFPTVTSNNLYIFTAHYYAFAFLLACGSVLLVKLIDNFLAILGGSIMIALSLGIYQAYLPFILTMYVLLIMFDCLNSQKTIRDIIRIAFRFLAALIGGLVLYFVINRIFLKLTNSSMDTYMGMDTMGKLELASIPSILGKCYSSFIGLFLYENYGINHKSWLRLLMLLCCLFLMAASIYKMIKNKIGVVRILFFLAATILFPIAIGSIHIMVQDENVMCTMTVYSIVFVFIAPICLGDSLSLELSGNKALAIRLCLCAVVGMISLYYSSLANETYLSLEYANQNTIAYYTELATQIKSLDGFSTDLEVAFIGENQDKSIPEIDCDYIIRGTFTTGELLNIYSREYFMTMHSGYGCKFVDNTEYLSNDIRVKSMPTYPSNGSIAIIDDVIVVKFS